MVHSFVENWGELVLLLLEAGLCIQTSSGYDKASVVYNSLHVLFLHCYSPFQGTVGFFLCA